jgi:branched-chain amino acid transport system permease protein
MSWNATKLVAGVAAVVVVCFLLAWPRSLNNPYSFVVTFSQLLLTGLAVGSVYALGALGWTLIFKCSGVLNLAMGELTLIGGYVCLSAYQQGIEVGMPPGGAFIIAVLGTLVVGVVLGLSVERLFLRPMIGEPVLAVIMITVGLSFLLRGVIGVFWQFDLRVFNPPVFATTPMLLGPVSLRPIYLWSLFAMLVLLALFAAFFQRTRWGLSMQATADDEMAALSLGVSAKFVYAIAWAIAFATAGIGGIFLGNVNGLNISIAYQSLLVLPAVVLGGMNSIPGAIVGGLAIGILQNLAGGYLDQLVIGGVRLFPGGVKDIFPFVVMMIVLLFKPYGLWGWERIERV